MSGSRIEYPPRYVRPDVFDAVQRAALSKAQREDCGVLISAALNSLADCVYGPGGDQGATYRSVSYAARLYGMGDRERQQWIRVVEDLGLTQRHVGHIISRAFFREPPEVPQLPDAEFQVGDRVRHPRFGVGEVVEVEPRLVRVSFGGDGEPRTFMHGYLTREAN